MRSSPVALLTVLASARASSPTKPASEPASSAANETASELGRAASLFSGPVEVLAESADFHWLESPVYSDSGNYLLFSDVKWPDPETGFTCGMIWKYDDATKNVTEFLKCSGLAGPPGPNATDEGLPADIGRRLEAGSNGLFWKDEQEGTLYAAQHGWQRLVQLNVNDVNETTNSIDEDKVEVITDAFNGIRHNAPNDMVLVDDVLYFSDPPYGLQYNDVEEPFGQAFTDMPQDKPGVYRLDPETMEPERLLAYDVAEVLAERAGPNGVGINEKNGDLIVAITDFNEPRTEVYAPDEDGKFDVSSPKKILPHEHRIEGENAAFPALTDGLTYDPDRDVVFVAGPAGMYVYDAANDYDYLGLVRVDDLCANNVVGGGYLWMTCNHRLLRVPLAEAEKAEDVQEGDGSASEDLGEGGGDGVDAASSSGCNSLPLPSLVSNALALAAAAFSLALI
ncbi:hypothetical protein ACHAWF_003703 [Thalassiosira exigua]